MENPTRTEQIEALKWSLKLHLSEIMTDLPAGEVPFFQFVDEFSNEEQKEDLLDTLVQLHEISQGAKGLNDVGNRQPETQEWS